MFTLPVRHYHTNVAIHNVSVNVRFRLKLPMLSAPILRAEGSREPLASVSFYQLQWTDGQLVETQPWAFLVGMFYYLSFYVSF